MVPSVCFTPWSGVRILLTTAPASLPRFCRWRRSAQLQFLCGLHETASTLDIPSRWDLQQRRPRPVADAGRSCWGSGQQDARAAQGTRGCWEPQPEALSNSPLDCCLPPAGGRAVRFLVRVKTAATTVDIPGRWDPRANQSPTGALVAVLRTAALFDSRAGQIKNPPSECSRDFYDPYGNRTHVTAVKGPCLNRLTNGP